MNAPPEGSDTSEEVGSSAVDKTQCSHVCQRQIYNEEGEKKEKAVAFKQSDKTQADATEGRRGGVFNLRNSRLMQNKRASLNMEQEKLQLQHSIWLLLLRF